MSNFEILTLAISLLAVTISAISLFRTRKLTEQQLELDKIHAELSKKHLEKIKTEEHIESIASIDVGLVQDGENYKFILENIGGSDAKNVFFSIEACKYNPIAGNEIKDKIPFKEIKPGKSVSILACRAKGADNEYTVNVRWTNPNGEQVREKHVVTW